MFIKFNKFKIYEYMKYLNYYLIKKIDIDNWNKDIIIIVWFTYYCLTIS